MMTMDKRAQEREEIEVLLPWHAAGTLNRRDAERVERALVEDADLARHYEVVREELAEAILLNETLGAPSARAMEQLFAKIDAEGNVGRKPATASFNLGAAISQFFGSLTPRTLAWSAAGAALAIVLQAGILAGVMLKDREATYGVASYHTGSTPAGSFAVVRFAPTATAGEIAKFLESYKAVIVDGPKRGTAGMYRVRVSEAPLPRDELTGIVKKMQQDKIVGLAAPTE
jgi:hypothetical protein